ncbi:MAG: hypothetical protein CO021_02220, partial [Deltaproteobacteria bacterium CG_4_9_14_0_2_um_filter_42_21]
AKAAAVFENMVFKTGVGNMVARVGGRALGVFADLTNTGGPGERAGAKIGGTVFGAVGAILGSGFPAIGTTVGGVIGNTLGGVVGGSIGSLFDDPTDGSLY